MKYFFIGCLLITTSIFSCKEKAKSGDDKASVTSESSADSLYGIRPASNEELSKLEFADSLHIMYFDDPDGDSLRYQRFFSFATIRDTASIHSLTRATYSQPERRNTIRPCRSEGKIYLYKGDEVLKTVYFSDRKAECSYLYYISNGEFLYYDLPANIATILHAEKGNAIKP